MSMLSLAAAVLAAGLVGQPSDPGVQGPPAPGTAREGLPPPGTPGPWDNDLWIYRRDAAGTWTREGTWVGGGAATLARLPDNRLIAAYQWYPFDQPEAFDRIALVFSQDAGATWTEPQPVEIEGMPSEMRRPFDPSLLVLPDGRVRLYFTSQTAGGAPAIYSAISEDGKFFAFEPGARFAPEGLRVMDCTVVLLDGTYHLFAPMTPQMERGVGRHATSTDGLTFEAQDDVVFEGLKRWLGCAVEEEGAIRFFGTDDDNPLRVEVPGIGGRVWTGTSVDGKAWVFESFPTDVVMVDPAYVALDDGAALMVGTGEPRPDTPSARNKRAIPELHTPRKIEPRPGSAPGGRGPGGR